MCVATRQPFGFFLFRYTAQTLTLLVGACPGFFPILCTLWNCRSSVIFIPFSGILSKFPAYYLLASLSKRLHFRRTCCLRISLFRWYSLIVLILVMTLRSKTGELINLTILETYGIWDCHWRGVLMVKIAVVAVIQLWFHTVICWNWRCLILNTTHMHFLFPFLFFLVLIIRRGSRNLR